MSFPGNNYAPPGVYTTTNFDNATQGGIDNLKIPVLIGEGEESLLQSNLEVVRGSSSVADQRVVKEDSTGRAVANVSTTGVVTLAAFDGVLKRIQVRNFPIVDTTGTGTTSNSRSDVTVTVDGVPTVVTGVTGVNGIIDLVVAPAAGADVRVTYYFNRSDTSITDDVSDQVTPTTASIDASTRLADLDAPAVTTPPAVLDLHGDVVNTSGQVVASANNVLILTVDGVVKTITFPSRPDYTVTQIAALINASVPGSAVASRFTDNFGLSSLRITATQDLVIGAGSANAPLGLIAGSVASRRRTFYTFQGPIVDGSGGGVTTTDPALVLVTVNNTPVDVTAVDGANRAVTLAVAPPAGSVVRISYFFNAWQDTFDYLAHINVSEIIQCGDVQNSAAYIEGADFVLRDDRIHWGTSAEARAGDTTEGAEPFDDTQISWLLVDDRTYLSPCAELTSGTARTRYQLPFDPTTGNGRDTPLTQSVFDSVANGRIDLASNRPDLVRVHVGYGVQDALSRGPVTVAAVDGSTLTLALPAPAGASVYASFYYNRVVDADYVVRSTLPGISGVGSYEITTTAGTPILNASYDTSSKGAGLTGVAVNFPSGSELSPDLRFETVSGTSFAGPTEEVVTVQFANREATPAKYTSPGNGPFELVGLASDRVNIYVDGAVLSNNTAGDAGLSLSDPTGHGAGFFAQLVGEEIIYTGGSVGVVGQSYDITGTEILQVSVDNVIIAASIPAQTAVTVDAYATALNEAASGHQSTAVTGGASTITLNAAVRSAADDFYNGWIVVVGDGSAAAGEYFEISDYVGSTGVATIDGAWVGGNPALGDDYYIYNPLSRSALKGATRFDGPVAIAAGKYDELVFAYVGDTGHSATLTATITPGTYATAADLAAELDTQINAELLTEVGSTATLAGARIDVSADPDGRLQFELQNAGVDFGSYLTFITGGSLAVDFAILAGLDTAATTTGAQAKLLQGPIAKRYTPTTASTVKNHDRLILRNRILPGGGATLSPLSFVSQGTVAVGNGSGNTNTGLTSGATAEGGFTGTVTPATLVGAVGFAGGQGTAFGDARDYQASVTFYDGLGANPANNILRVSVDGTPVTVTFTASSGGTQTAVGPVTVSGSVLDQIVQAFAAVPGAPFGNAANVRDTLKLVRQEGAGIRISSRLSTSASSVVLGSGSANAVLGFNSGQVGSRNLVSVDRMVSALNSNRHSSAVTSLFSFTLSTANYFATDALATKVTDAAARTYLQVQSNTLGTASSVQFRNSTVSGTITRDALFPGTRLLIPALDGDSGEAALQGFFVTSSDPNGSGSVNTSVFNNGVGADGFVGQTYRDAVTGLTFTILPRGYQDNPNGPWISYPVGSTATLRFDVRSTFTTNANLPTRVLPGVELTVANTTDVPAGDSAVFTTFKRGGAEPAVGDFFYVTYRYLKESFATSLYTKLSSVESAYGPISIENPLSLAAYYAFLNGAFVLGLKQVRKATGSTQAPLSEFISAVDELEGRLAGQVNPDILVPLRGDSLELLQYIKRSVVKMSSIRYRSERTCIAGPSGGTLPSTVMGNATALNETRMRLTYPDIFTTTVEDARGNKTTSLVDGFYAAAALAGSVANPSLDVATPWVGRKLIGFDSSPRTLNEVQMNEIAAAGVNVLNYSSPFLEVRDGLTTRINDSLLRLPTIIMIHDEVQRQARAVLKGFAGSKQVPGLLAQIEGRLSQTLKAMVRQQIITQYTSVSASVSETDPTLIEVQASYSPVFPVKYIVVSFSLRTSL